MTEGEEVLLQSDQSTVKNAAECNNNSLPLGLEETIVEEAIEPDSPTSGGISPRTREMLAKMEELNRSVNARKQRREVYVC